MAATPSTMLPLGTTLPSFSLPDVVSQRTVSTDDFQAAPVVVAFVCNHCPFVKHIRSGLADFGRFAAERGVTFVAVSSNDVVAYPQDAPPKMVEEAREAGYTFPYLYDESQEVAKAFRAACTPEFYLFDTQKKLAYRGQFDASRPGNSEPVTGKDLKDAVDAVLAGGPPPKDQQPSIGCNIKWRSGNRPDYA
jgi:thiol-disulfide isomerase/thioredoxin